MIFERGVPVALALSVVTAGCAAVTAKSPAVSVIAPTEVALPAGKGAMTLQVIVRLHNPTKHGVKLFAPTPCAVFRWSVVAAAREVQAQPRRLCAQVVATDTLRPGREVADLYQLALDPDRYAAGERYRLNYQFWRHKGQHEFTVTAAP